MTLYAAISTAAAMLLLLIFIFFALVPAGLDISFSSISLLYGRYNHFYLLNLIPVFAAIAGGAAGLRIEACHRSAEMEKAMYEKTIERSIDFVKQITTNDLNTPYRPVNGEKVLEGALEDMRRSLIITSSRESERNEISTLSNEIGIMLQSCDDIEKLGDMVASFLVSRLRNVVQAAFYVAEGENDKDRVITMKACYAYNRRKYLEARFRFAQGLVGQAAVERDIIHRTEIPDDYLTVKSGILGDRKPGSLLISPLIANDSVCGVVELASFERFTEHQCTLVKEISKVIAGSLANVISSLKTYELLMASEKMSRELTDQKKKLLQNAEDLIVTRDQLKKSNQKLEEQIVEVHNTSRRINVLLENANEVITIFSGDFKILYVSPSIKRIMGYYPEEIIGKDHSENIHPLDTERFLEYLRDIRSYPEKVLTLQYRYFTRDGEVIWLEASSRNLLNDEVIRGIIINSRDISEQRIAVKEQRMRAKMQALSENSSDIIIRIDIFSRCTYINPVIEQYTGDKKENYLNKSISNTSMDASVVTVLKSTLEEVSRSRTKKALEISFPSVAGSHVMHLNAIPEFSENGETESVLFVFHDITETKAREEIIRKKNKSISDSINYAFNIQSALMPTEDLLHRILPNSFMFYKPKDVVSGDYPWLFRCEDSIYVGAMDCTGHGVPGALMSIIGYFLQSAIVDGRNGLTAGEVLNRLHHSVVKTLRQEDPQSKINDGMDAALCRINLKKRELDFAGAHRQLFHVSRGVLAEIRGDRFPVGSTQYRNRKDFTNHTIKINKGDSVYFMTDGFTDQFGGPTGKQKYSGERAGQLIRDNQHLSIFQMGNLFRRTYDEWRGEIAQLDDVLVIGIKF